MIYTRFKGARAVLLVSVVVFAGVTLLHRADLVFDKTAQLVLVEERELTDINAKTTCKYPVLDPWDPSIRKYLKTGIRLRCDSVQYELSYVDEYNYLHINEAEMAKLFQQDNSLYVYCSYWTYERSEGLDDSATTYDDERSIELRKPMPLNRDHVWVECKRNGTKIYQNVHALVANTSKPTTPETEEQLSVLLFLIDSTSQSMARRYLPKTFKYITENMKGFVMNVYNKVADNSFPNVIPILTGKRVHTAQPDMPDEFGGNSTYYSDLHYDDWPIIWKNFSAKGYVTQMNEDEPMWGVFHYPGRGFAKKPVDHSYRPFMYNVLSPGNVLRQKSNILCYGIHANYDLQIDIARRIQEKYKGKLKFSFNFLSEPQHHHEFQLQFMDDSLHRFFSEMHTGGHFNKTVVIFGGDHGPRFATMRQTLVGVLEERMTFLSISLPDWLRAKYPHLARNLEVNRHRLTSNFDVYETMVDVLKGNYAGSQRPLPRRGLSLFYPIPFNRTCTDAGVPRHYCICLESIPADLSDPIVIGAAKALVVKVNEMLAESENTSSLCARLVLDSIVRAEMMQNNERVRSGFRDKDFVESFSELNSTFRWIRVAINVAPSEAMLEATLKYDKDNGEYYFEGEGPKGVSRLNAYGDQSACLPREFALHRHYCYCNPPEPKSMTFEKAKQQLSKYRRKRR